MVCVQYTFIENRYTKYGALYLQHDVVRNQDLLEITDWNDKGQELNRLFNGSFSSSTSYYPSTGQIKQIINGSSGNDEILDYAYDVWGNIKNQSLIRGTTANESFTYDSLHRLTNATLNIGNTNTTKSYAYNNIGNITSKSDFSTSYVYGSSRPNAVTSATLIDNKGTISYGYDNKGNRVSDNTNLGVVATYKYDYKNLLIESTSNISNITGTPQTLEFSYGADNQRYRKYDKSNNEITIYGNKDYEQIYKNGILQEQKYYLTSYLTVTKKGINGSEHYNFMQKDRLGSTTQILDENGLVLHTKSYDAFGKPRNGDWSDMGGGLFNTKLSFYDPDKAILNSQGEIQYDSNGDVIVSADAIDLNQTRFYRS